MQSIHRAATILRQLAVDPGVPTGVSELARATNLPKTLVHRTLRALVETGLAAQDADTLRYRLGQTSVELGAAAMGASGDLRAVASSMMRGITEETGETSALSVRVGNRRIYCAQIESAQNLRMSVDIGKYHPLYAGSAGRAMLATLADEELDAYLAEVELTSLTERTITDPDVLRQVLTQDRALGYSASRGERVVAGAGVSVAITDAARRSVIGALSVVGPDERFADKAVPGFARALKRGAQTISQSCFGAAALQDSFVQH